jgi:hypothetical protein
MINQYDVVESLINIPKENLYIGETYQIPALF